MKEEENQKKSNFKLRNALLIVLAAGSVLFVYELATFCIFKFFVSTPEGVRFVIHR